MSVFKLIFIIIYNYLKAFWKLIVPPTRKDISGQIVLVTGAGHGIGREIARLMSLQGATLVVWDIDEKGNNDTVKIIRDSGGKAFGYRCDVTSTQNVKEVAARMRKDVGDVDILVNNAGLINCGWILDLEEKDLQRTYTVNHLSHYWIIQEFLPSMIERKRGHIAVTLSGSAILPHAVLADYSSTKAAGYMFHECLKLELLKNGHDFINVTELFVGFVDTGFLRESSVPEANALTPLKVAEASVDGILRNYYQVSIPNVILQFSRFMRFLPQETIFYLANGPLSMPFKPTYKKTK